MAKPNSTARSRRRLKILITAGPTREYLDSVRFISNASSGRMGYAIARAAARRGHLVTLVSGPVELRSPSGVRVMAVTSAADMARAAKRAFRTADAAILVAAVSDYRPIRRVLRKRAKSRRGLTIRLVPTDDIAETLGRVKGRRVTIGFALEDHAGRAHAEDKLRRKRFDAILLNRPSNIGSELAAFEYLVSGGRWVKWEAAPKRVVAQRVIRQLETLSARQGETMLRINSAAGQS